LGILSALVLSVPLALTTAAAAQAQFNLITVEISRVERELADD